MKIKFAKWVKPFYRHYIDLSCKCEARSCELEFKCLSDRGGKRESMIKYYFSFISEIFSESFTDIE